jgi:cytochrome c553
MIPAPSNHIIRLVLVLALGIGGFFWIKGYFVPEDWDSQRWFRSGALEDLKQQPALFAGNEKCMSACHGKTRTDHQAVGQALLGSVHHHLSCESCHGPLNESEHQLAAAHIARDSGLCLRCHDDLPARPRKVGLFSESLLAHRALHVKRDSNCIQCHEPHSPRPRVMAARDGQAHAWLPGVVAMAEGCDSCHKPGVPFMPQIAGQPEEYLRTVMRQQRAGTRHAFVMGDILGEYSDDKIETLARYYADAGWTSAGEQANPALAREGAALHQRRCAGCHGEDGRRASGMTPRLAGQTISHLQTQLKAYIDPRTRLPNEVMRTAVRGLSEREVEALAHYYATEPVARPKGDDLQSIVAGCNACHQPGFTGMPLIAGQPATYLTTVLRQYRDGGRASRVMKDMLKGYSDGRLAALAQHYATTKWQSTRARVDVAQARLGAKLHGERCAACHGADGRLAEGMTPRLAGQPGVFMETQLKGFLDGHLPGQVMRAAVQGLSAAEMRALGQYYAADGKLAQTSAPAEAGAPAMPEATRPDIGGKLAMCNGCHRPMEGSDMPLIAGQPATYLDTVMRQQRDGQRDSETMGGMFSGISNEELAALAEHYASSAWVSAKPVADAAQVRAGEALHQKSCAGCHADGGRRAQGMTPRLAGQPAAFVELELNRYRDAKVKLPSVMMRAAVKDLKPEQVKALADYYEAQGK